MIANSPRSLSVEFQRVCMYGSEPRLSTVIPTLSKFNNRLKAPSLIVFKSQVSLIIMDYVFGLFLILAYLFGAVWLCDVQSVTLCFQNFDYAAVSDPQKACLEVKEYEDCVSPYADACADNAVFATYQNQIKLVQSSCKASTSGSCDVIGLQKCMAEVESSQGESRGPQDTCKSYPRFVECVEPAIQGCNSSNPQYRNIQASIDSFRRLCDQPG
ncbi:uncharacterized protein LOC144623035 [Crassostrea virginica]